MSGLIFFVVVGDKLNYDLGVMHVLRGGITCFRSLFEEMVPVCRAGARKVGCRDAMRDKFISLKVAPPRETGTLLWGPVYIEKDIPYRA